VVPSQCQILDLCDDLPSLKKNEIRNKICSIKIDDKDYKVIELGGNI
jgi:hypothetical protein